MESGKEIQVNNRNYDSNLGGRRQPFDFGIKRLKKSLRDAGMPKKQINEAVKMYKFKLYTRVEEVKAKMEKELLDASDK